MDQPLHYISETHQRPSAKARRYIKGSANGKTVGQNQISETFHRAGQLHSKSTTQNENGAEVKQQSSFSNFTKNKNRVFKPIFNSVFGTSYQDRISTNPIT